MERIIVVADDLTGALDTTVVLFRQGMTAGVALRPDTISSPHLLSCAVVGVTTETRHATDPTSALRALWAGFSRECRIYKKIDSTLRGAFGVELATLLDLSGLPAALLIPSLPSQGRTLRDSLLHIDGVPHGPSLPDLLQKQTGRAVAHIPLGLIRDQHTRLVAALREALRDRVAFIVADGETDDDLRRLAEATAALSTDLLIAGSAGFAAWLPVVWGMSSGISARNEGRQQVAGPLFFVFGSANRRTQAQIEVLKRSGVVHFTMTPEQMGQPLGPLVDALRRGEDAMLTLEPPFAQIEHVLPELQQAAVANLGSAVAQSLAMAPAAALILGGGDTAFAVCRALEIQEILLDGEVLPGLPTGRGLLPDGTSIRLVTKAGGFGAEDALVAVRGLLR